MKLEPSTRTFSPFRRHCRNSALGTRPQFTQWALADGEQEKALQMLSNVAEVSATVLGATHAITVTAERTCILSEHQLLRRELSASGLGLAAISSCAVEHDFR